jgi:NHL repeat
MSDQVNYKVVEGDDGNHTVRQPEGRLLMTMGTLNGPSDTGYDGKTTGSISRTGPPFNRPTNVAIGSRGNIYISDGYGNSRVHMFSPTGQLKPRGASPETVLASSGCRTGSPVRQTGGFSCATARSIGSRSSARTAST